MKAISILLLAVIVFGAAAPGSAAGLVFVTKTPADGLGSPLVSDVFVGDAVYAATWDGLSISSDGGGRFINRTSAQGLPADQVYSVYASGKDIYAGTLRGLAISTNHAVSFTARTKADGLGANLVWDVYATGGLIYAATNGGLSISNDGGVHFVNKTREHGLGSNVVNDVFARGRSVYAATDGGLSLSADGGEHFVTRTTADGLGSNAVIAVFVSDEGIYAATSAGLSISSDGGVHFVNRTMADGLGSNLVRGVYVDHGVIYAATGSGLSISTDDGVRFVNQSTKDGLAGNSIKAVFAGGGRIYAASDSGLALARTALSGKTQLPGVTLRYYNDGPQTVVSDASGNYTIDVPYNWSGMVTPWLEGYTFHPASRSYDAVLSAAANQDYSPAGVPTQTALKLNPDENLVILACGLDGGDCDRPYARDKLPLSPYAAWAFGHGYELFPIGADGYADVAYGGLTAKRKMASDIFDQIKGAPGYVYLIGHSAGADAVILAVDLALSEKLDGKIKGVALLDPYFSVDGVSLQKPADRIASALKGRVFLAKSTGYTKSIHDAIEMQYHDEHRPLSYNRDVFKDIRGLLPGWK